MKKHIRRAILLILTLVFLAGPLGSPAAKVRAEDEFDIDGTAFTNPSYDTAMMYFWHEGLPSVTKDKQGNFIKYPVLITWKGTYYLCTDASFKNELNETHTLREEKNDHHKLIFWDIFGGIGGDAFDNYERVWGTTNYYMRYLYDMSGSALLGKLGLDVTTLSTLGEAVSMTYPDGMPYLVAVKPDSDQYAIGLNEKSFGKDCWLIGRTRTWEEVVESLILEMDESQKGNVQWGLDYQYWEGSQFLNVNYEYRVNRYLYYKDAIAYKEYKEGPDQHYWTVKRDNNGLYHFWTTGESDVSGMSRVSDSFAKDEHKERTFNWIGYNDIGRMSLYYKGSRIGTNTPTIASKNWNADRVNTINNTDGYKVYYADPNIVSFYRDSFTVAKGQVITLDGPVVLDNSCTVTVKDGGVLSCSGWVINNGQIKIEPGGMLILQERSTATGDSQYGCISSVSAKAGSGSGRIACDGTIIVNRDCKLTCAGTYGLQLGTTAQVVNYGQIISENLEVSTDHIIENRGDTSAVFAGWGLTDSGYALTRSKIIGQSYNAMGTREKTAFVFIPKGGVYGPGADRVYVNRASSVTYEQPEKGKKRQLQSGYTAPIGGSSYVPPVDLPSGIPIYYDEEYDTPYISVGEVIYQFDGLTGRWVSLQDGEGETFYDYRMPSMVEEYLEGKLPEGYKLVNGLVVGQKVKEDLYYDTTDRCYWFSEDSTVYYYEMQLGQYICVLPDTDTYLVYSGPIDPPPNYASEYIPPNIYQELPEGVAFYRSGMRALGAAEAKPKVTLDRGMYCVEVGGEKYYWSSRLHLFVPKEYSGSALNGYPGIGISAEEVDLDGYTLP